ncbi:MAG: A24 family peptidase [Elusimicrobiota bacterium]|nr:A24 family peptidase [Elusimicrobiota bacterium]
MSLLTVLFFLYIAVSSFTDLKYRKVYNVVTLPAVVLGIGFNFLYFGLPGLKNSIFGFLAGFLILFIFFVWGGVGPGDVKFLAGAGALAGLETLVMGALYGAIIAGVYVVFFIIVKKDFKKTLDRLGGFFRAVYLRQPPDMNLTGGGVKHPYALFLSIGLLLRWLEINYWI